MVLSQVSVSGVSFSYARHPGRRILRGISLKVNKGELVGVIGNIGVGKSTLLYCINGIIPNLVKGDFKGKVRVAGKDPVKQGPRKLAGKVGFLFQDPDAQIFSLTVRDEVAFALENAGLPEQEVLDRVAEALEQTGLTEYSEYDPNNLSFGQRQKVALASVLAMKPEILLLDEPTASLDHKSAQEIYSIVRGMCDKGACALVVEHNTEYLAEHADRVLLLQDHDITLEGKPEKVFSSPLMKELGIKVPCSICISGCLGMKPKLTPADFEKESK